MMNTKMLGAVVGDIIGSRYEFQNVKTTDFELFTPWSTFTDDSVMTLAVAKWLMEDKTHSQQHLIRCMQELGQKYPKAGYGGNFDWWLRQENPRPYESWGNGSGMRVSPVGLYAKTLDEALALAAVTASVSHNHPEGVKGAQAIAASVFLCKTGRSKQDIKAYVKTTFGYNLDRTIDEIRPNYYFDVSCQGSVPEAIIAFLEGNSFEEVVRLAVSLGGDSDTIGCMAGAITACMYPIPDSIVEKCNGLLTDDLREINNHFFAFLADGVSETKDQLLVVQEKDKEDTKDDHELSRFLRAQGYERNGYNDALQEVVDGRKHGHWIWYIFPQVKGLGHSDYSEYYGIGSQKEAAAYLKNDVLGKRLREISSALLQVHCKTAVEIFGHTDAMKVKSCMTLFDIVSPHDIFERVLEKYYDGQRCKLTLKRFNINSI